ncbi:MAG: TonB-dependent receptor [Desulfobacterales bacterium]|nr:TonB-dependent receptor [Desulfobacterales bacterium]
MKIFSFKRAVFYFLLLAIFSPKFSYGSDKDSADLELSFYELENQMVVTAARQTQKMNEAPASMSVVTAEDIRQLGATQIGEALRMIVGVHFGYTNASSMFAGGIRGFHKVPSNKIVLLIDGIPWSLETYAFPLFNYMPISIEEIDRIEVLRGPGSSLYGPNSMFGVINLITKKLETTKGNSFKVQGGEYGTLLSNYMFGGGLDEDRLLYRLSINWEQRDDWGYIAWQSKPSQQYGMSNINLKYIVNDNSEISLLGSYMHLIHNDLICESTGPIDYSDRDAHFGVITYHAKSPNITIKVHDNLKGWNKGDSFDIEGGLKFKEGRRGIEAQSMLEFWDNDTLVFGANFTQDMVNGIAIGGEHIINAAGIFFDNTYRMKKNFHINTGLRFDFHPNTGETLSHRIAFTYEPYTKHNFRLMWGSSYRNPDYIESYYDNYKSVKPNVYLHIFGQEENKAENASTFEFAYNAQLTEKFLLSANVFYTVIKDFIYFTEFGERYQDTNLNALIIPYPFHNIGNARQVGTEWEIKYQFTKSLKGIVNYAYLKQTELSDSVKQLLTMTPEHLANAELNAFFDNGISTTLTAHYKSSTEWRRYTWANLNTGNTEVGGKADSYMYADLRIGYNFKIRGNDTEIAVTAFNLFNNAFEDYPIDTANIGRRITGLLFIKF